MDEETQEKLKWEQVSKYKNPVIQMHPKDFEDLKNKLSKEVSGFLLDVNPRCQGVPVRTNQLLSLGQVIIIDDIENST